MVIKKFADDSTLQTIREFNFIHPIVVCQLPDGSYGFYMQPADGSDIAVYSGFKTKKEAMIESINAFIYSLESESWRKSIVEQLKDRVCILSMFDVSARI